MGGAFALLMACMARLRVQISPDTTKCYAFGAPPVLARAEGAHAENVLQVRPQECEMVASVML